MFRSFFIFLSKASWARKIVTGWSVAWKMANRFVAGEKLDDAVSAIKDLNARGINATLDHLGEHTTHAQASLQATQDIVTALDVIQKYGVRANISIKLTQIGLKVDRQLCTDNLKKILRHAQELNNFIRIDMEDSPVTQTTLDLVYQMRQEGFDNFGTVIQSYLFRSELDVRDLIRYGVTVRLCKGAYKEAASVAFPRKADVDQNYDRLADILLRGALENGSNKISTDGRFPPLPAIATHDENRIKHVIEFAKSINLPLEAVEFQMLHGIRRDLQEKLVKEGFPVRVYVPYGTEWYPYFMRRLAERPANVWFFVSNFLRK